MEKIKPTVMRSIRIPTFLDNDIHANIKKVTKRGVTVNTSGAYKYFLELGITAYNYYHDAKNDPDRAAKAKSVLDSILGHDDMIQALGDLPPNVRKAVALAVNFLEHGEHK